MHIAIIGGGVSGLSAAIAAAGENPAANITISKTRTGKENPGYRERTLQSDKPFYERGLLQK